MQGKKEREKKKRVSRGKEVMDWKRFEAVAMCSSAHSVTRESPRRAASQPSILSEVLAMLI